MGANDRVRRSRGKGRMFIKTSKRGKAKAATKMQHSSYASHEEKVRTDRRLVLNANPSLLGHTSPTKK